MFFSKPGGGGGHKLKIVNVKNCEHLFLWSFFKGSEIIENRNLFSEKMEISCFLALSQIVESSTIFKILKDGVKKACRYT